MTTEAPTAQARESGRPSRPGSQVLPHPFVLSVFSGVLLWLTFPPAEWAWAAWLALVPLFLLIKSRRSPLAIYFGAWAGGYAFWVLAVHWIWWTDESAWLGWLVMALVLSLWWPAFVFLARFADRGLRLPAILTAPIFWVMLEYLRAYILTGFPWYYLAHSQYRLIYLTQVADFAGSLGVSFLIAGVNAYLAELLTTPLFRAGATGSWWRRLTLAQRAKLASVVVALAGALGYGGFRVNTARFREGPRIALLQSGEVQQYDSDKRKSPAALQAEYERLVAQASRLVPKPELIVWPETSNPYGYWTIDPKLAKGRLDALVKELDPENIAADFLLRRDKVDAYFAAWMKELRIPMMVGTTTHDFRDSGYTRYNSAVLFGFEGGAKVQSYHKFHLVPFGEYVPLLDTFPWLIRLTPYRGTRLHFLDRGADPAWFELGPYRMASAICFEDTVPQVVRRLFADVPDARQPDVLVNLSNDGWFHETSEHEMHLAVSTFRSIENRAPLVRAVNTGVSAIVDGNGRILQSMAKDKVGVLSGVVPLDDRTSFYTRWGDWLGLSCLASAIGLLVLGTFSPRRRPNPAAF